MGCKYLISDGLKICEMHFDKRHYSKGFAVLSLYLDFALVISYQNDNKRSLFTRNSSGLLANDGYVQVST